MKTAGNIQAEIVSKRATVASLIKQLHQEQLEIDELTAQLQFIDSLEEEIEEEASVCSNTIKEGDRALVISPHKNRQGTTGHVEKITTTKHKTTAEFVSDKNDRFSVQVYNLFKLKKKTNTNQEKKPPPSFLGDI